MRDIKAGYSSSLIERSKQIRDSLNVDVLNKAGIARSRLQFELFNQYPPIYLLRPIKNPEEIFSSDNDPRPSGMSRPLALYVHIPFCLKKCTFCCFFSIDKWADGYINRYLRYLEKEICLLSKKEHFKKSRINSVHFGGGTPTLLNKRQLFRLTNVIRRNFCVAADAEFTFETTPESLNREKLEYFRESGFNRLSIGIQTFDNHLLRSHKRLYTAKQAVRAFKLSRRSGFSKINIDLLFGLTGQDLASWDESLKIAADLGPANVTAYPFMGCFTRNDIRKAFNNFQDEGNQRLLMHIMAIEKFTGLGYIQVTPYQFIRTPEYSFKQQEHKSKSGQIHAFGVTGHSFLNNVEYHNHHTLKGYEDMLLNNIIPIERGRHLSRKEQMIRFAIYNLQKRAGVNRKDGGIDKAVFAERFGVPLESEFSAKLRRLLGLGLIKDTGRYIRLSYLGILYHTEVCQLFYLKKDREEITRLF
ncbi:coproporphyrinogen III oxidase family protein [bacterium]|nr:MAG: coproporphyrinogen III oxidase family protein [bacterium]